MKFSIIFSLILVVSAYFWGEHISPGVGLSYLFIALVLGILEVSLSFDNAVVNAYRLEKMTPLWQRRFLTWGILIAVFGMRFVFPIAIVAAFTDLNTFQVIDLALNDPIEYSTHLHDANTSISAFGGIFLLMIFLSFMLGKCKETHWIKIIEEKISSCKDFEGIGTIIALVLISIMQHYLPEDHKLPFVLAAISGLILFLLVDGLSELIDKLSNKQIEGQELASTVAKGGFMSFLYLELIDASFSFDGVIGAFAISKDIVVIAIGLGIGALFVRSLTILLVEKKVLHKYIFLEHGAHWAIGALALIMMYSTVQEVSEIITGLIGLMFIIASFFSSLHHNRKMAKNL